MKTIKAKALMYGDVFVDNSLLHDGVYASKIPALFNTNQNIDGLIHHSRVYELGETYRENLRRCKLVSVTITIDKDQ